MRKFIVEQVAICPRSPEAAIELLTALGAGDWAKDHVHAKGEVFGSPEQNEANLAFNYQLLGGAKEFEVLNYTEGWNWMSEPSRINSASHLGMHCTAGELEEYKAFFRDRGIPIAQEVVTQSHTNPVIKDLRRYNYCIFDTKDILGIDLKFIVRIDL
jgi:hypothetical protein